MFVIVFRYIVASEQKEQFEACYGAAGEWENFFRERSRGYLRTDLLELCDASQRSHAGVWDTFHDQSTYLLQDCWGERKLHEQFLQIYESEYRDFSILCEQRGLYQQEERIGEFHSVQGSARV